MKKKVISFDIECLNSAEFFLTMKESVEEEGYHLTVFIHEDSDKESEEFKTKVDLVKNNFCKSTFQLAYYNNASKEHLISNDTLIHFESSPYLYLAYVRLGVGSTKECGVHYYSMGVDWQSQLNIFKIYNHEGTCEQYLIRNTLRYFELQNLMVCDSIFRDKELYQEIIDEYNDLVEDIKESKGFLSDQLTTIDINDIDEEYMDDTLSYDYYNELNKYHLNGDKVILSSLNDPLSLIAKFKSDDDFENWVYPAIGNLDTLTEILHVFETYELYEYCAKVKNIIDEHYIDEL